MSITATEKSGTDHWYRPILKQQCSIWTQISWKHQKIIEKASKCDDQQEFKDILEDAIVSTLEGFTNNSVISPRTSSAVKKPNSQKSLCMFTNGLDVKNTANRRVGAAKSKRKAIKFINVLWALKNNLRRNLKISE